MSIRDAVKSSFSSKGDKNIHFDDVIRATNIIQTRVLHSLFTKVTRDLMAVKGGIAMRALGNYRNTGDIDFSAVNENVNFTTLNKHMLHAIDFAGKSGLIDDMNVTSVGLSPRTLNPKWKISGKLAGTDQNINVKIEFSTHPNYDENDYIRSKIDADEHAQTDAFTLLSYSSVSMAASKIKAAFGPSREKVRDIFDLYFLIETEVSPPVKELSKRPLEQLIQFRDNVWPKISKFDYESYKTHIYPYIKKEVSDLIDEDAWNQVCLVTANNTFKWIDLAIQHKMNIVSDDDVDLELDNLDVVNKKNITKKIF